MSITYDSRPATVPARMGQATAVEAHRAAAEVMAAVQVAQSCPRDISAAVDQMRQSCRQLGLAERAFYSFPRAGGTVSGASIHLARELARIWGNIDYGIAELRRDDEYHQSEMKAFAWDMQANTRNGSTFIVPHKRDTKNGVTVLKEMRDIYENNANNGARRVREAIFALLPPWFKDEAIALCRQTLSTGDSSQRLDQRIETAVARFRQIGVSLKQLEDKIGSKRAEWQGHDVAELGIIFNSIDRREITIDEAFPPERVTIDEIVGQARQAPANVQRPSTAEPAVTPEAPAPVEPAGSPPASDFSTRIEAGNLDDLRGVWREIADVEKNGGLDQRTADSLREQIIVRQVQLSPASDARFAEMRAALAAKGADNPDDQMTAVGRILGRHVENDTDLTGADVDVVLRTVDAAEEGLDLVTGLVVPAGVGVTSAKVTPAPPSGPSGAGA